MRGMALHGEQTATANPGPRYREKARDMGTPRVLTLPSRVSQELNSMKGLLGSPAGEGESRGKTLSNT